MSWDIYGEPLRRGHCEVHPYVHEEYPCSVCIADKKVNSQQGVCTGVCENEHYLSLAQEHIKELEQQLDIAQRERDEVARDLAMEQEHHQATRRSEETLAAHVEFCHEVMSMVENGPDYLVAKQYRALRLSRERKPETSLARLKAQWQAEVLEHTSDRVALAVEVDTVRAHLRSQANKLRQQAEGEES